jgi:hypothetical protein
MKKLFGLLFFTIFFISTHFSQLDRIKYVHAFLKLNTGTLLVGANDQSEWEFVLLDDNFQTIKSTTIPSNKVKSGSISLRVVKDEFYVYFTTAGLPKNAEMTKVVIKSDLSTYKIFDIKLTAHFEGMNKVISMQKGNKHTMTEGHLKFYEHKIIGDYVYILFAPRTAATLPFDKTHLESVNHVDYNLYAYKGKTTLVKYKMSEITEGDFPYLKFDQVWYQEFEKDYESKFYEDIIQFDRNIRNSSILAMDSSENKIVLQLSGPEGKFKDLVSIDASNGKVIKTIEHNSTATPTLSFNALSNRPSHIHIKNQKLIFSFFNLKSGGTIMQLYDYELNPVGDPVTEIESKKAISYDSYFESPNHFYFVRAFQLESIPNYSPFLLVTVENRTIKHSFLTHKTVKELANKNEFNSSNFIGKKGKIYNIATQVGNTFYCFEDNSQIHTSHNPNSKNEPSSAKKSYNSILGALSTTGSYFFQSPSGDYVLWVIAATSDLFNSTKMKIVIEKI